MFKITYCEGESSLVLEAETIDGVVTLFNSLCREDGGWIEHNGGPMPVSGDTKVSIRYRNSHNSVNYCRADTYYNWEWNRAKLDNYDIVAYRIAT